ncbi:MAG: EAL domain-containing protein [Cyanophyceae cyanobacterium]
MKELAPPLENASQSVRHLIIVESENSKKTVYLENPTYSIGRSPHSSIIISSPQVSRHHATIIRRTDKHNSSSFWVLDGDLQGNRSKNGILVNHKKCLVQELKHGDVIDFSPEIRAHYYVFLQSEMASDVELPGLSSNSPLSRAQAKSPHPTLIDHNQEPLSASAKRDRSLVTQRTEATPEPHRRQNEFLDAVTNLPSRTLFEEQLSTTLDLAKRHQTQSAVLYIRLDPFERLRDISGENAALLQGFAQRVKSCLRSGDIFAHWEGKTFAILLPQVKEAENTVRVCRRIADAFRTPLEVEHHSLPVESTIGIAVYPQDGETSKTLLRRAEEALTRQQKAGYQFYSSAIASKAATLLKLENGLHRALERQEFSLHYQPQINFTQKVIYGVEALIRWCHPEFGQVTPVELIALAEKFGLTAAINEWVLKTACAQAKAWQQEKLPPLRVSVNLSPHQFQQPNLVDMIAQVLQQTALDPHWLELEITEAALHSNTEFARRALQQLRAMQIYTSIDDFGLGNSSLNHLKEFPFHGVKIDRSLIQQIGNPQNETMIAATIALGRIFNLRVVAEGVETTEQLELLRRLECEEMQGYRLSYPLQADKIAQLLQRLSSTKFEDISDLQPHL